MLRSIGSMVFVRRLSAKVSFTICAEDDNSLSSHFFLLTRIVLSSRLLCGSSGKCTFRWRWSGYLLAIGRADSKSCSSNQLNIPYVRGALEYLQSNDIPNVSNEPFCSLAPLFLSFLPVQSPCSAGKGILPTLKLNDECRGSLNNSIVLVDPSLLLRIRK